MKPGVFYFNFYFEDDESDGTLAFTLSEKAVTALVTDEDQDGFLDEMEFKYGVHDWSTSPSDEVVAVGFATYEVSKDDSILLMNEWRDKYIELVGADEVGDIVAVSGGTDFEIFQQAGGKLK